MKSKIHKLSLDDFFVCDYRLIAVFSEEPDYRMAFLLNHHLDLHFEKTTSVKQAKTNAKFSVFDYVDEDYYRDYKLIANHQLIKRKHKIDTGLFSDYESVIEETVFYIKSMPKANFLLKIIADEPESFYIKFIDKLKQIPQIYTTECVDLNTFKEADLLKL